MKIKVGDKVKMLGGKDRGKTGKVLQVLVSDNRVMVEGLNLIIKHQRPKKQGEKGQRLQFPRAVNLSKVALICPKCGAATRVGFKIITTEEGKRLKSRRCLKCQETF